MLEHLYIRPVLEAKYFLKVREDCGAVDVVPASGANIMRKMDVFGMHEYEFLSSIVADASLK